MALTSLDPTEINCALDNAVGAQMRPRMTHAEWEQRLDAAAYAAAAILDAPVIGSSGGTR